MNLLSKITYPEVTPVWLIHESLELVRDYFKDQSDNGLAEEYSKMSHYMCFFYRQYMNDEKPKPITLKSLLLK